MKLSIRIRKILTLSVLALVLAPLVQTAGAQEKVIEGRAIWAQPGDAGRDLQSVRQFVEQCKRANVNLIAILVKGTDGHLFWPSKRFPRAVHPDWKDFDFLAALAQEAHKRGIRVHAWLCDFTEGKNSPVFREHPEWAMVNGEGKTTDTERVMPDQPYSIVWMCPARRPGYTDQWLIPLIEELVRDYPVDGIHHDYVRYPGDVAPDNYCFCDYCVLEYFKHNHLYFEARPDRAFPLEPIRSHLAANWERDPTVRPPNWNEMSREEKAKLMLEGSSMTGGRGDLDYYFYTYRTDAITRFVREAWQRARRIRSDIQFSAAVFKNPMTSGRFIGQRWTDFAPWVDIMMPMNYRSHYPGDFQTYLEMLSEYTRYSSEWCRDLSHVYIGIATHYLYQEEYEPLDKIIARARQLKSVRAEEVGAWADDLKREFARIEDRLLKLAPDAARGVRARLTEISAGLTVAQREQIANDLIARVSRLRDDPPAGYYPPEKLKQAVAVLRQAGAEGVVIFAASSLTRAKLWPTLGELFDKPSVDPDIINPLDSLSIQSLRQRRSKQ